MNQLAVSSETPESDNDATCAKLINDEGFQSSMINSGGNSRPVSVISEAATSASGHDGKRWVDIVAGMFADRGYSQRIFNIHFNMRISALDDGLRNAVHLWHRQAAIECVRGARPERRLDGHHQLRRSGHS